MYLQLNFGESNKAHVYGYIIMMLYQCKTLICKDSEKVDNLSIKNTWKFHLSLLGGKVIAFLDYLLSKKRFACKNFLHLVSLQFLKVWIK